MSAKNIRLEVIDEVIMVLLTTVLVQFVSFYLSYCVFLVAIN